MNERIAALALNDVKLATKRASRACRVAKPLDNDKIVAAKACLEEALRLLNQIEIPTDVRRELKKRGLL